MSVVTVLQKVNEAFPSPQHRKHNLTLTDDGHRANLSVWVSPHLTVNVVLEEWELERYDDIIEFVRNQAGL